MTEIRSKLLTEVVEDLIDRVGLDRDDCDLSNLSSSVSGIGESELGYEVRVFSFGEGGECRQE